MDSAALQELLSSPTQPVQLHRLLIDPCFILIGAAVLEMLLPLPASCRLSHLYPLFTALGAKVNRPERSSAERYFAGIMLPLLILGVLLVLSLLLLTIAGFEALLIGVMLLLILELHPQEALATKCAAFLRKDNKAAARALLQPFVLRDCSHLSAIGIAKAACECVCLRLFAAWFAVITWYLILGVEGALMMQSVFVLNTAFNVKKTRNQHFGLGIRRILQAMLLPPVCLYALLHLLNLRGLAQIKSGFRSLKACPAAPCSGFVLGLTAWVLNIELGGPRYYDDTLVRYAKVGTTRLPQSDDILHVLHHLRFYGFLLICLSLTVKITLTATLPAAAV